MTNRSERIPEFQTLVGMLRFRARHEPDRRAFTYLVDGLNEDSHRTYGDLDRHARALAVELRRQLRPGDRALLLYPPGLDFISAYFGCLYAGVLAVPAYPPRANRPAPQLEAITRDARPGVVLTCASLLAEAERRFTSFAELGTIPCLATDAVTTEAADDWQPVEIDGNTLAFLQYTSGSTALPKGVMVTHGNLLHNLKLMDESFGGLVAPDDTALTWVPPYHDMGLIGTILAPIYGSVHCYQMSPMAFLQRPMGWLEAISHFGAASSTGPNFAYELCVSKCTPEHIEKLDLSKWRVALCGSEPIRAATLGRFAECFAPCGFRADAFSPCYGLGEATLIVTGTRGSREPIMRPLPTAGDAGSNTEVATESSLRVSCGVALGGQDVVIADPQTCAALTERMEGEIWVRGPSVAQGYWGKPAETEATFQSRLNDGTGPFLRTGDLGYLEGGELFVTGRIKELIIIRGRNHYPQDIEHTVGQCHPALQSGTGAAFAIDDAGEERLVVACEVQRNQRHALDVPAVAQAVRRAVSEAHGIEVHALALLKPGATPRTSSGKIQRAACRESYRSGSLETMAIWTSTSAAPVNVPPVDAPAPVRRTRDEIRRWLVERLAERLQTEPARIDCRAAFQSFALDSHDAVAMSGELEEWLGRKLAPTLLYDYTTTDTLADYLALPSSTTTSAAATAVEHSTPALSSGPAHAEPIAIVGLGCRFPGGASDPQSFWRLLRGGLDAVSEAPADRWDNEQLYDPDPAAPGKMSTRWGGFLPGVDQFDAGFFGISPREAASMDPQQRLFLEVSWEALEHAGQAPDKLFGSQTGVFLGVCGSDYMQLLSTQRDRAKIDAYYGTGNAFSVASGRLSYVLGLQGPNLPVDTACSSSLVAVHLAVQSLRGGECRLALAGGVNMLLSPEAMIYFSKVHAMAADGRCKAFDASADGYVRGEGCGVVVLKRLSDALADGDRVLALVRGTAINHDGRSNGLTAPNGVSQERVIRQALANAAVDPESIGYVEAHGTGTALGDPIEARALSAALGAGRTAEHPLVVGSVKTNIGHLEAAAGIAGLIKSVLALQHGEIPANLHFKTLNPHIPAAENPLAIPVTPQAWPRRDRPRRAGISSFGFGGTNAHLVLEEAPPEAPRPQTVERPLHILTLSAKRPAALADMAERYETRLAALGPESIEDACYTANTGRSHFPHRLAVIGESAEAIQDALAAYRTGSSAPAVFLGHPTRGVRPKFAFLFSGDGPQRVGMARDLFLAQPTFRRALESCDQLSRPWLDRPLLESLYSTNGTHGAFEDPVAGQVALVAIEFALAGLWRSWGVVPDAVVGHGLGELAAACDAGTLGLEDALRFTAQRARLLRDAAPQGPALAVAASEDDLTGMMAGYDGLAVTAVNGPRQVVVAGPDASIEQFAQKLRLAGIPTHSLGRVPLDGALSDAARGAVAQLAAGIKITHGETVYFGRSVQALAAQGIEVLVEVGPAATLTTQARLSLPRGAGHVVPTLRAGHGDWRSILESLAVLYVAGVDIDWAGFDRDYARRKVELPTYAFQRERHWFEPARPASTPEISVAASEGQPTTAPVVDGVEAKVAPTNRLVATERPPVAHPAESRRIDPPAVMRTESARKEFTFDHELAADGTPLLADHEVFGECVAPGAWYIATALRTGQQALAAPITLEDMSLLRPLVLSAGERATIQVIWDCSDPARATFRLTSQAGTLYAAGSARPAAVNGKAIVPKSPGLDVLRARCMKELPGTAWYQLLADHELRLGPTYQWCTTLWRGTREALGRLERPWGGSSDGESSLEPGLIDACFQLVGAAVLERDKARSVWVPVGFDRMTIHRRPDGDALWGHAALAAQEDEPASRPDLIAGDVTLLDDAGRVCVTIEGVHLQRATAEVLLAAAGKSRPAAGTSPTDAADQGNYRLEVAQRGVIDGLQRVACERHKPGPRQVEIQVRATGLNFRDVLNVLGLYPGDPGPLGGECAGVISAVGEGVSGLAVGDEVLALAPGSFAGYVTTLAPLVVKKPAGWSMEQAAASPIAFLTAHYALNRLARLAPGERVLIHAATGGVGLAAIQVAQTAGAEIFATAGSPAKREHLASLGIRHIMDSRSTDFAEQIREKTGGRGVDVILNSLAGEAIAKGLSILAPGGRFVEIGKTDLWDAQRVAAINPTITYRTIALDKLAADQPELVGELLQDVLAAFARGDWQSLPRRDYPMAEAQAAFRYMAQARHIGKIVLVPPTVGQATQSTHARPTGAVRARVLAAPVADRPRLIEEYLRSHVARALDVPEAQFDADARLNELGFDSLMAVEIKNHLELDLGVNFNLAAFLEGPTLRGLVGQVLGQMTAEPEATATSASPDPEQLLENLDALSAAEVDALLSKMLTEVGDPSRG